MHVLSSRSTALIPNQAGAASVSHRAFLATCSTSISAVRPSYSAQAASRRAENRSTQTGAPGAPSQLHPLRQQQQQQQLRVQEPLLQQKGPPPRQKPQQLQVQPDPAADDLDLLAAAAAAPVTASAGLSLRPDNAVSLSVAAGAPAAPAARITSIPDAEPRYALPAGRKLRYAAADKLQLSGAEMRDIGMRLRTRRRGWPGPFLKVWRYGIDDLRLYQAIDLADLEGRVVVVDSTAYADVVLTTYSKRTRKGVNLATAKRAAAGASIPLLILPAMSAHKLVQAVGPLLGLPTVEGSAGSAADASQQQCVSQGPCLLRWDELEGDGSDELLQLMWGSEAGRSSSDRGVYAPAGPARAVGSVAGACCPTPRWCAWCAAQAASPSTADALFAAVRDANVEDAREGAVPSNPLARAGERHRLLKPLRPYSRIKRRQLRHDLSTRQVDW